MKLAEGRIRLGSWWIYLDTDRMFIGRNAKPDDPSIIYSLLGLVAEQFRPDDYDTQRLLRMHDRAVRKWQRTRDQIWGMSSWMVDHKPGETDEEYLHRRMEYLSQRYNAVAGDARARHAWVPTLLELRDHATTQIPAAAYDT